MYRLWRLAECAQKRPTHTLAVAEACFPGDPVNWMTTRFHHGSGGFDTQALDCLGRRLPRLLAKESAELPGTEVGSFRKLLDR